MIQIEPKQLIDTARNQSKPTDERVAAIHALARMRDETALQTLIHLLKDDSLDIRWAASTALRKHGADALKPLLTTLATHPADSRLYESAHRVLNHFGAPHIEAILTPVVAALEESASFAAAPVAAVEALKALEE